MSATYLLFERWMTHKGFQSRRAAMLALGLSHATAEHWKHGRNGSLPVIERMANDLGEDYVPIVMQVFLETARDEPERKAWKRLAKRLTTGGLALVLGLPLAPSTSSGAEGNRADNAPGVYIMRSVRSKRRTRKGVPVAPGIFPDTQPLDGRPLCRTFPAWIRYGPATLPCSRSTDEHLRSQRVRLRNQQQHRPHRALGRLEAARVGSRFTR